MSRLKGTNSAKRKDGSIYYRSSITYKNKHISLGSYSEALDAHHAYLLANDLLSNTSITLEHYKAPSLLSFQKWVVLINYRTTGLYFNSPILLKRNYFIYYLSQTHALYFDVDDLFYYSNHPIHRRQGYYFVNDYGMQVNLLSRYGIRNHCVKGKDYIFTDGNDRNFRYDNIDVLNPYHGIEIEHKNNRTLYKARIHLNGNTIIGRYSDAVTAAIAYNKAIDFVRLHSISQKRFEKNFIEAMTTEDYKSIYATITIGPNLKKLIP